MTFPRAEAERLPPDLTIGPDLSTRPIAFFDVDGTLTTTTGIFEFLRHYLLERGYHPSLYHELRQRLGSMASAGVPREETNRAYFRYYTDADAATVDRIARDWFESESSDPDYFRPQALARLRWHQDSGHRTALVSGSFPAILGPLAEYLGIDEMHCTRPVIQQGRYTGGLAGRPMIGARKAEAVRVATRSHGIDSRLCFAYGDHVSDLPMLRAVGHPIVVGDADPALTAEAARRGWKILRVSHTTSEASTNSN